MTIEDAIEKMSKSYLERIVKSFTNDRYSKDSEDEYKKQLLNNTDHLRKPETIKARIVDYLDGSKDSYQSGLLINFVLTTLLGCRDYAGDFNELAGLITKAQKEIIKKSSDKNNLKHIPEHNLELFQLLLEAALEDDLISEDELHLIQKVRAKLKIHKRDQYLILAKMKMFPQKKNSLHSQDDISLILNDLQKCGVIFYCNKASNQPYVIPEEMAGGVKKYLGIELVDEKYFDLLESMSLADLRVISDHLGIKTYGKKEEIIDRIILTGFKPSEALGLFDNGKITEICRSLPDVKVSGKMNDKINRIIDYYDQLVNINVDKSQGQSEIYYDFYEQLAKLDMQNLMGKKIVKNEKDAANAFEIATTYIFEKKLNHKTTKQKGTEHSDGCVEFANGELLLWDNKAIMKGKYDFPKSHLNQFKRYIRDWKVNKSRRVNCFIIVVPDYEEDAGEHCDLLKYESGSDTDISIVSASSLKWLAEEWSGKFKDKPLNLHVFNRTGILNRSDLKKRLKLFSK